MKYVVLGIISRSKNNQKQYLLVSSVLEFGKYTGFYYPPGGHFKKEGVEKAMLIEKINEELGILVIPFKKIAETPADVKNETVHWWYCSADVNKIKIDTRKIARFKWFTKKEILSHKKVWPATKKFFKKYISD